MTYELQQYVDTVSPDLGELIELGAAEGCNFIVRTKTEWEEGCNTFSLAGEAFFLAVNQGCIVGMCGLNRDPYLDDLAVGRLRHLYVHPGHRRIGVAKALVMQCLSFASGSFVRVRLRTSNSAADGLYRSVGFRTVQESTATHEWRP